MPFVLSSVTTGSWRADCFRGSLASAVGRGRWSTYSTTGARKQTSSTHRAHWTRSRIRWQVTLGSSLKSVAILMRASSFARLLEKTSRQPESNKVVRLGPQTKASGRRAERLRRRRRPPLNGRSGVPVVPIPAASRAPLAQVHATPQGRDVQAEVWSVGRLFGPRPGQDTGTGHRSRGIRAGVRKGSSAPDAPAKARDSPAGSLLRGLNNRFADRKKPARQEQPARSVSFAALLLGLLSEHCAGKSRTRPAQALKVFGRAACRRHRPCEQILYTARLGGSVLTAVFVSGGLDRQASVVPFFVRMGRHCRACVSWQNLCAEREGSAGSNVCQARKKKILACANTEDRSRKNPCAGPGFFCRNFLSVFAPGTMFRRKDAGLSEKEQKGSGACIISDMSV